jgi:predicted SprT family Zn-dependent metalloprotease
MTENYLMKEAFYNKDEESSTKEDLYDSQDTRSISSAIDESVHRKMKREGVMYYCNQCEYKATSQGTVNKHHRNKHEGVRYFCTQCEFQATEKGSLKKHENSIHDGVQCPASLGFIE